MSLYAEKYEREDFELYGRMATIIKPEKPRKGNPYIWRTEFLGAFDSCDREMLARGYYLLYYRVSNMYGCPESIEMLHHFQIYMTEKYKLADKAVLFGFSRGGLYAFNYAAKYPECVGLIYLDAPVLDIRSWPAGFGDGIGAPKEWEECKGWYHLTDESAKTFTGNPLDKINNINIPIILVVGLKDTTVPYAENGEILAKKYKGKIKIILKPECDHHPHSLDNPVEIADFIEDNT